MAFKCTPVHLSIDLNIVFLNAVTVNSKEGQLDLITDSFISSHNLLQN